MGSLRRSIRALRAAAGLLAMTAVTAFAQTVLPAEPAELAMRHLEALRTHDFAAAYALASRDFRRTFSRSEFEWMLKRAHPEVAGHASAVLIRTRENDGFVYVTVRVQGRNGKHVEALFEIVREGDAWKVNALTTRPGDNVL
ncbi:MAG TPA: DUF4864 domain-containing protein [Terriglobales bacterium]|nr:DUF4864 domain-containing protein [Terriglobales bacterium]